MSELEEKTESVGGLIVWGLMVVVGFFIMLGLLTNLPQAIPSTNPYGAWLPWIILVAYIFFVYVGYKKARNGQLM